MASHSRPGKCIRRVTISRALYSSPTPSGSKRWPCVGRSTADNALGNANRNWCQSAESSVGLDSGFDKESGRKERSIVMLVALASFIPVGSIPQKRDSMACFCGFYERVTCSKFDR